MRLWDRIRNIFIDLPVEGYPEIWKTCWWHKTFRYGTNNYYYLDPELGRGRSRWLREMVKLPDYKIGDIVYYDRWRGRTGYYSVYGYRLGYDIVIINSNGRKIFVDNHEVKKVELE